MFSVDFSPLEKAFKWGAIIIVGLLIIDIVLAVAIWLL